jgi:hypothetical protein
MLFVITLMTWHGFQVQEVDEEHENEAVAGS